ncbi:MAG: RidA family protein [Dehalococcoidia bacterium]
MERKAINTPKIYPYDVYACTHATRVGNTIYLSGQASVDAEGNILHQGDVVAQCAQAFDNMKMVLEADGAGLKDLVQYSVYVLSNDVWDKISETRRRYLNTDPMPACVGVVVKDLYPPGILIEIDAIAVVD